MEVVVGILRHGMTGALADGLVHRLGVPEIAQSTTYKFPYPCGALCSHVSSNPHCYPLRFEIIR
jgi:hypothetical protein